MPEYDCTADITGYIDFVIEADNKLEAAKLAEKFVKEWCNDNSDDYRESRDGSYSLHIKPDRTWVERWQTTGIFQEEETKKLKESMKQEA